MTGYVLYGYPESGSASVEVAMVDAGIPFEMKDLDSGEPECGQGSGYGADSQKSPARTKNFLRRVCSEEHQQPKHRCIETERRHTHWNASNLGKLTVEHMAAIEDLTSATANNLLRCKCRICEVAADAERDRAEHTHRPDHGSRR